MRYAIVSALLFLAAGCSINTQTYTLTEGSKPQTIVLQKQASQGHIHALNIVGKGYIEGDATIALILNGNPYKTEKLSGRINFRWRGDWYSDQAEIRYEPEPETQGQIKLNYKFESL